MNLIHGSLESGIGMFDLAAEKIGWTNAFHCEINEFCRTILKYYWSKAHSYADIYEFCGTPYRGLIDVVTAGFPCQPFSNAGKGKGRKDDRFIWPENMRLFREIEPPIIVCENVPGLLTNENGLAFEQVCFDLENEGYEVQTYIIPALGTNKDHKRNRIWIVAYSDRYGQRNFNRFRKDQYPEKEDDSKGLQRERLWNQLGGTNPDNTDTQSSELQITRNTWRGEYRSANDVIITPDTTNKRLEKPGQSGISEYQPEDGQQLVHRPQQFNTIITDISGKDLGRTEDKRRIESSREEAEQFYWGHIRTRENWYEAATRLCSMANGHTRDLDTTSISKAKWRRESLKAYGNTIIWEIAYNIFDSLETTIKEITKSHGS